MARIRTIKPTFFTSLTIAELSDPAKLTFIGLWTYADDEGRGMDDARLIKAALWPLDDRKTVKAVDRHMAEIAGKRLIERYQADGRSYFQITAWDEHQKIDRKGKSAIPRPPRVEDAASQQRAAVDGSPPEGKGREGKGTSSSSVSAEPRPAPSPEEEFISESADLLVEHDVKTCQTRIASLPAFKAKARENRLAEHSLMLRMAYRENPDLTPEEGCAFILSGQLPVRHRVKPVDIPPPPTPEQRESGMASLHSIKDSLSAVAKAAGQ